MNKGFIIKSLVNGIIGALLFALIMSLTKGVSYVDTLLTPSTAILAVATAVGSYFGYKLKEKKDGGTGQKSH